VEVPDVTALPWIEFKAVQSRALVPAIVDLGPGEAEVIGLGLEHPGSLLILDDRLARQVAALNRIAYTGTVGVLIKGKQAGHLESVRAALGGFSSRWPLAERRSGSRGCDARRGRAGRPVKARVRAAWFRSASFYSP
jgi:hypothetical protein